MQALKEMRQEVPIIPARIQLISILFWLYFLSIQTEGKRALRQTIKQKRKSLLDERLALIRAHKRQTRSKPADDQHSSNTSMNITDDSGKGGKSVEATSNEVVGPAMDQLVTERAVNELLSNIRRKVESGMWSVILRRSYSHRMLGYYNIFLVIIIYCGHSGELLMSNIWLKKYHTYFR